MLYNKTVAQLICCSASCATFQLCNFREESVPFSGSNNLCRAPDGATRQALLTEYQRTLPAGKKTPPAHELKRRFLQLLHDLENDCYITETAPDLWDFGSGIFKSWWRKYYA